MLPPVKDKVIFFSCISRNILGVKNYKSFSFEIRFKLQVIYVYIELSEFLSFNHYDNYLIVL